MEDTVMQLKIYIKMNEKSELSPFDCEKYNLNDRQKKCMSFLHFVKHLEYDFRERHMFCIIMIYQIPKVTLECSWVKIKFNILFNVFETYMETTYCIFLNGRIVLKSSISISSSPWYVARAWFLHLTLTSETETKYFPMDSILDKDFVFKCSKLIYQKTCFICFLVSLTRYSICKSAGMWESNLPLVLTNI